VRAKSRIIWPGETLQISRTKWKRWNY